MKNGVGVYLKATVQTPSLSSYFLFSLGGGELPPPLDETLPVLLYCVINIETQYGFYYSNTLVTLIM